jgi:hypothetical protein
MLGDLVVDTNVFEHASNPGVSYCAEARRLLTALQRASTVLRVDEGFDPNPARNRSLIMGEYFERLKIGMLAFALVSTWASTRRIVPVSSHVAPEVRRQINQTIGDRRDRTFLKVAINSDDHFLCSHDFIHFSHANRAKIGRIFGVRANAAGETLCFL